MTFTRRNLLGAVVAGAIATPFLGLSANSARAQAKPVRVGYIADYFGTSLTAIASD